MLIPLALLLGEPTAATWAVAGFVGYVAGNVIASGCCSSRAIRRLLRDRGETLPDFTPAILLKLVATIPLTQLLYMASVIDCMFMRQVDWRGVTYKIDGPWNVQMIDYQPMAVDPTVAEEQHVAVVAYVGEEMPSRECKRYSLSESRAFEGLSAMYCWNFSNLTATHQVIEASSQNRPLLPRPD